ncbi:MAG: PadR family transcriptional regulator [Nocardioides sp.]|uniref:PadR family transcriptional regulator n=1 Tax=Nocardioides sp. TaxID=35761 RepID=UPI003EFC0282
MTRRGDFLELAVLGLLTEGPLHGYELRKRLNLLLGWRRLLSYGSLYPALKKMSRRGLIAEIPLVGPPTRRPRIVYEVTELGTTEFQNLVSQAGPTAWEDDSFDVRFAFFGATDLEIRLRVLEGRRSRLLERLSRMEAVPRPSTDGYAAELRRHRMESVERELRWLNELIRAEQGETPSAGADGDSPAHVTHHE